MLKWFVIVSFMLLAVGTTTAVAAPEAGDEMEAEGTSWVFPDGLPVAYAGAAIGTGLILMGAARGIGNIGASSVEAIARQPEAGGRIFTSMLLSAALIEGATFFAIVLCLLIVLK